MRKKILISIASIFVVAVAVWNLNWSLDHNKKFNIALQNLVAMANDEHNQGGENVDIKDKYKRNYENAEETCDIVDVYTCEFGLTIPDWVPYVGGTKCEFTYIDEVHSKGTRNPCKYTGNKDHACDYYQCQRNG